VQHPARGHRILPHTADAILEAWGPDLPSCCEEAVAALASLYVEGAAPEEIDRHRVHVASGPGHTQLLDLLEEVIFVLDTAEGVPVRAVIREAADGGLDAELVVAAPGSVVATGAVPKAVSRSELAVDARAGGVRCRFLVDV
jgi:SHS2 domain-containing protein